MPQYYSNANVGSAFSDGLMAGYEFVDRIRQRRRQLELEERRMSLAENADERAQAAEGRAASEYAHDVGRRKVTESREDRDDAFLVSERNRTLGVRDEVEGARRELAGSVLSGTPTTLSSIAAQGPRQSSRPAAATVPQIEQPRTVSQNEQPAGPVDLRAAQRDTENAPGFVERLTNFMSDQRDGAKTRTAESFWGEVADPNSTVGTAYHSGIGHSVPLRDVRLDPAKYSEQYLQDRNRVPAASRASLDLTMSKALREKSTQLSGQIAQLDPKDPKVRSLGNQLVSVNNQMTSLAKAATQSAASDAGITRPVKLDDARLVPAVTNAAAKARDVQPILETTPEELRAAQTVVTRAGNAKRLNEKQIQALSTLYAHGQIDAEQLTNWSKYGTPIAPKQASIQALGGGYAAMINEGGISIIRLGQAGGESAESRSNQRLLVNDRLKQIQDGMKGMVEAGELSDGSPNQHFNKFLQVLKREAPNLQLKSGIPLLSADGALDLASADPGEVAETLEMYRQYDEGEVQPWFFKAGKTMTDYAPEGGETILDLTDAFR